MQGWKSPSPSFLRLQKGHENAGKEILSHSSVSCDKGGLVDDLTGLGGADRFDAGQFPAQASKFSRHQHCLMEEPGRIQLKKKSTRTTFQPKGEKKKKKGVNIENTLWNALEYFRNIKE